MPRVTLADIQAVADTAYGPFVVELPDGSSASLLNPLRLPKPTRRELSKLQERIDADVENVDEHLKQAIRLVAASPGDAERLLAAIGDDLALIASVFRAYSEDQEVGEASPSAS